MHTVTLYRRTTTTVLWPFVSDCPSESVAKETFIHLSCSSAILYLLWSTASSLLKLRAWQSFCTTSLQVLCGLPFALEPSASYSIHFFIKSLSSVCNTCPCHHNLFCCSTEILLSIPSLAFNYLLETIFYLNVTRPSNHSHFCPLKCHLIYFPYRPGLTSIQQCSLLQ